MSTRFLLGMLGWNTGPSLGAGLLLEDGFFLLLEDGAFLLLE